MNNQFEQNNVNGVKSFAVIQQSDPTFREQFLTFIGSSYNGLHRLKFKKKQFYGHQYYDVRASYGARRLFSRGKTVEIAASRFLNEIKRKVIDTPLIVS
jgi:hypothetical protein